MSDLDQILAGQQNDDDPEIEFVDLPPGQEPPSNPDNPASKDTPPSKDGFSSGSSGAPGSSSPAPSSSAEGGSPPPDPLEAITKGFKELGEALKDKQTVQPQIPVQKPGESDEEFAERLKEALFSENPLPALKEAVERFTQPVVQQQAYTTMELAKRVMELDPEKGPIFKKYKSEIDAFIKTLPPNVQMNPGVYEYAYKEIYARHMNDIIEEKLKEKEEEIRKKVMEELKGTQKGTQSQGAYMTGEPVTKGRPKKRVYVTQEERDEAERRGIPLEDYLRIKGRL